MPEKSGELEAASTSSLDAMDGSMSSGYPTLQLSSGSSDSGSSYLWLLKRPARLSLADSASLGVATPESASPRISSSGSSEASQELEPGMSRVCRIPPWWDIPPPPPPVLLQALALADPPGPGQALAETHSPQDDFTSSKHPSSSSSTMGSLSPPSASVPPPTEAPPDQLSPDNAEVFDKNMMKKLGLLRWPWPSLVAPSPVLRVYRLNTMKTAIPRTVDLGRYVSASSFPSSRYFGNPSQKRFNL
jgi:hypothetical protein